MSKQSYGYGLINQKEVRLLKKLLVAVGVAATVVATGGNAFAAGILPDFTIDPSAFGGPAAPPAPCGAGVCVADKITGNYAEVLTVTGLNTFATEAYWDAGQFVADDGTTVLQSNRTGLGFNYAIYALFNSSGTFAANGSGGFDFTGDPGGTISVYLDQALDTTPKTLPASAPGAITYACAPACLTDDVLLATASLVEGAGQSGGALASGDFGLIFSPFVLTATGSSFFIAPSPFYLTAVLKGQFNSFTPSGSQTINGSADAFFSEIPEPGSLTLLGMGLVGLARRFRRKTV